MVREFTIGEIYKGIRHDKRVDSDDIKPTKIEDNKYIKTLKSYHKRAPSLGSAKTFSPKIKTALEFLNWKITPKEYDAGIKFISLISIISSFALTLLVYILYLLLNKYTTYLDNITLNPITLIIFCGFIFVFISIAIIYYFSNYPIIQAEKERRRALAYMPQIIGYIIMSLKLVPNLERAIKFAAIQGEGKLSEDLKQIIWETNIGMYSSISEALDVLAYRWQDYSKEFKEAVMMIKSSMVEDNDARRAEVLDKVLENVLSSIKIQMEIYAKGLSQPSLVLFYVGILLPLLLVIILPIGSVFAKLPFATPWVLATIYNIALPLFLFLYARHVLNSIPSVYTPPSIHDKYKGLPKKNNLKIGKLEINIFIIIAIILVLGIFTSSLLQVEYGKTLKSVMIEQNFPQNLVDNPDLYFERLAKESLITKSGYTAQDLEAEIKRQKYLFTIQPGNDITPYYIIYGLALTLVLCIFLYFFFTSIYKKRIQDYYTNMEEEFQEILYILANRMGEGKPIEDALKNTKDFFKTLSISEDTIAKSLDNLNLLGLPIEQAFFDPTFGSLKENPSKLIVNNIKLIVDSTKLGVITGAKTTLSIIIQLKNMKDIRNLIRSTTMDIVQMMNTMSTLIAPAVLGITTSMQKIVVLTLNSLGSSGFDTQSSQMSTSTLSDIGFNSNINPTKLLGSFDMSAISVASPTVFNAIMIIYVITLVIILSYFTSSLQENNKVSTKLLIAYTTPIAVIIFIVSSIVANLFLGG